MYRWNGVVGPEQPGIISDIIAAAFFPTLIDADHNVAGPDDHRDFFSHHQFETVG